MIMGFAKYWEAGKISVNTRLNYGMDLLAHALLKGIYIFIFINLWGVVYSQGSNLIAGFTLNMMIWYLVMTEAVVTSPRKIVEVIGEKVQSGEITNSLTKPYNFILFEYANSMGQAIINFTTAFIAGSIIAGIFIGGFHIQWTTLPLVAIVIILGLTLHFLIMALLAIFSFWIEDAKALNFIYDKVVFVLGGMLAPLEIFPHWLEQITKYLPFSYIAYYPAKLWVQFSMNSFWNVIVGELVWIIVLIITLVIVYHICIRNISINGG